MNEKEKTCCCTGHRPKGFLWNYYDKNQSSQQKYLQTLRGLILSVIQRGATHFISGGALGVDMDFTEIVLELRKQNPAITLEIAVPCPNQTLKWSQKEKARYQAIIEQADEVNTICDRYTDKCMIKRNLYMVDKSNYVIAVWNGKMKNRTYSTLHYAEKKNKNVDIILLEDFKKRNPL